MKKYYTFEALEELTEYLKTLKETIKAHQDGSHFKKLAAIVVDADAIIVNIYITQYSAAIVYELSDPESARPTKVLNLTKKAQFKKVYDLLTIAYSLGRKVHVVIR